MLERKRNDNVIRNRLVALLVACYFLFAYFIFLPVKPVYASETLQHHYETSGVVEDLKELKISENVRYDTVKTLYFLEYGYGYDGLYSIYIYTYIPLNNTSISNIIYDSPKNAITFGFTDTEEDVLRVDYHKLKISTKNTNENWYLENKDKTGVFVKWKVDLTDNNFILSNCEYRYYCVSGVELHEERNPTATEFLVGNIYECFNESGEDKVITSENLPTVSVDTYHTFYRTGVSSENSSLNSGYQDQISSCYFSLPKFIGGVDTSFLSSIKASFDYRYTTPILVLGDDIIKPYDLDSNIVYYTFLNNSLGKVYLPKNNSDILDTNNIYTNDMLFFLATFNFRDSTANRKKEFFYNWQHAVAYDTMSYMYTDYTSVTSDYNYIFDSFGWIFYDKNINKFISKDKNDFRYSSVESDYSFDGDFLLNYYNKNKETLLNYLFETNDSSFTMLSNYPKNEDGKYILTYGNDFIDENDTIKKIDIKKLTFARLMQNKDDGSLEYWEKLGNSLSSWWGTLFDSRSYSVEEICPFEKIDYNDVYALTDEQFSNKYFVDINEIDSFKLYCKENELLNKDVWVFRYDVSKYFSDSAYCCVKTSSNKNTEVYETIGLIARQAVYLDFDIIEFGFTQEGREFTISPNHSPKNVFNDLTTQQDVDYSFFTNFLSSIMMLLFLLALVVLVIVCWPFISIVFNGVGIVLKVGFKIVFIPFKLLGKLFKSKNDDYDDS